MTDDFDRFALPETPIKLTGDMEKLVDIWAKFINRSTTAVSGHHVHQLEEALAQHGFDWCKAAIENKAWKHITTPKWLFKKQVEYELDNPDNKTVEADPEAQYRFFVNCVINDGWHKALSSNGWSHDMLIDRGDDPATEYSGMDPVTTTFCLILHHFKNGPGEPDGNPAMAYAYLAKERPSADAEKRARQFARGTLAEQQTCFPYFRFQ